MNGELVDGEYYWIRVGNDPAEVARYSESDGWERCGMSYWFSTKPIEVISYIARPS
jgi:hypothetical protein